MNAITEDIYIGFGYTSIINFTKNSICHTYSIQASYMKLYVYEKYGTKQICELPQNAGLLFE